MLCEREEDLAMMNVDFGGPYDPLNTQFVLSCFDSAQDFMENNWTNGKCMMP